MNDREKIDFLASLYDLGFQSLDPLSDESSQAENQFYSEVAKMFDELPDPKPRDLKTFQTSIIAACRRRLLHGDKPTGI